MLSNVIQPGGDFTHIDQLFRPKIGTADVLHIAGDFTTYDVSITDDEGTSIYSETGTPVADTSPIFNTPVAWEKNATGYNFRRTIRATLLPAGAPFGTRTYTTVYTFHSSGTPPTYGDVKLDFVNPCRSLQGV